MKSIVFFCLSLLAQLLLSSFFYVLFVLFFFNSAQDHFFAHFLATSVGFLIVASSWVTRNRKRQVLTKQTTKEIILFGILSLMIFVGLKLHDRREQPLSVSDPLVKNVKVYQIDRNKNGKFDTLKFTYQIESSTTHIGFGGLNLCIGDEFRDFSCKNIHLFYPDSSTDPSGHELICSGVNVYTRYLYLDTIPKLRGFKNIFSIDITGADRRIFEQKIKIDPKIDWSNFESLPIGTHVANYPDYINAYSPIENSIVYLEGSCRCQVDHCNTTKTIELQTDQVYQGGLF